MMSIGDYCAQLTDCLIDGANASNKIDFLKLIYNALCARTLNNEKF